MKYEASELLRLVVALAVLPGLLFFIKALRVVPARAAWMCCIGSIYASYVFTIVEGFLLPDLLNLLQHTMYGVAGVAAAVGAFATQRSADVRRRRW